jgi:hypothetical protein
MRRADISPAIQGSRTIPDCIPMGGFAQEADASNTGFPTVELNPNWTSP